MHAFPVIVYGHGGIFFEYFNAVAATVNSMNFQMLLKMSLMASIVMVILTYITQRNILSLLRWIVMTYLVMNLVILPKASVLIVDRVNQNNIKPVDHVPLGLAIMASYTSILGDALTRLVEQVFSLPDDLKYQKTGMVFASRLFQASRQFQISDTAFNKDLESFVHQCVFYDIWLHKYTLDDLLNAKNTWQWVVDKASPARAFVYQGEIKTCQKGAALLNQQWNERMPAALTLYGQQIFPHMTSVRAKDALIQYLPLGYDYLTQLSTQASDIFQQNVMIHVLSDAVLTSADAPAALQSYAMVRAQEQKRATNLTLGEMAAYWLPLMKNAFEAILYGSFIFIMLLSYLPIGVNVLKHYVSSLLWLQAWPPLYAVVNLIVSYYAKVQSTALIGADNAITLKHLPGLAQINQDMAGLAGYISLSIPFLAMGFVKGMSSTFTQMAQYIGGITQSVGTSAANEVVTGNLSLGNTSFSTHNHQNTSGFHVDTSARINTGGIQYGLKGGSTVGITPEGGFVMDNRGAISSVGASVNLADSIRTAASEQASHSFNAGVTSAQSYREHLSQSVRDLHELSHHMSHTQANGESWSSSHGANMLDALNQLERTGERFSQDHHLSHSRTSRLLGSAYANVHADAAFNSTKSVGGKVFEAATGIQGSIGGSLGAKVEGSRDLSTTHNKAYSHANDMATSSDYAHNVDVALRAVQDSHFRTGDDTADRLLDSIHASLDKAKSFHQDATSSFQEAQSYQAMASLSQDQAISVNANASQPFVEWLAKEIDPHTSAPMGLEKAADILAHHPEQAQVYADSFSQQYTQTLTQDWAGQYAHTKGAIEQAAKGYQQTLGAPDLSQTYQNQKAHIDVNAGNQQLSLDASLDDSAKIKTQESLENTMGQLTQQKIRTQSKTSHLKKHIDHHLHPHQKKEPVHEG